jgi:hypothetical protein
VGEIGKSLQDIAPTRNLSGKIKEKYGGLKKFLERYPEEVVICADHPFNPHVLLRKPLTAADLELIEKGVIPPQLRKVTSRPLLFCNAADSIIPSREYNQLSILPAGHGSTQQDERRRDDNRGP